MMKSTAIQRPLTPKPAGGGKLRRFWSNLWKRFADGSAGTKLSHLIFGAGNVYHKQYLKGLLFFLLQAAILWVMIACPTVNGTPYGYKAILNLSLKNVHEGGEFDPLTG
ncbi:MAG: hypothetical protein II436_06970, partial [Oscillospiraceae bacterium]|nr:hypothetical protein [Oscillospiraceae bacterium]